MQWIESGGGPLVIVPVQHLDKWRGVKTGPNDDISDYDRACEVNADIAVLLIAGTTVLVLGDEPFATTWLPDERGGLLVRWVYADKEESISDFLNTSNFEALLRETEISITAPGACLLFDSAEPGSEIEGNSMLISLQPGTYVVSSALVSPSADVRLLIHRLVLTP